MSESKSRPFFSKADHDRMPRAIVMWLHGGELHYRYVDRLANERAVKHLVTDLIREGVEADFIRIYRDDGSPFASVD